MTLEAEDRQAAGQRLHHDRPAAGTARWWLADGEAAVAANADAEIAAAQASTAAPDSRLRRKL